MLALTHFSIQIWVKFWVKAPFGLDFSNAKPKSIVFYASLHNLGQNGTFINNKKVKRCVEKMSPLFRWKKGRQTKWYGSISVFLSSTQTQNLGKNAKNKSPMTLFCLPFWVLPFFLPNKRRSKSIPIYRNTSFTSYYLQICDFDPCFGGKHKKHLICINK